MFLNRYIKNCIPVLNLGTSYDILSLCIEYDILNLVMGYNRHMLGTYYPTIPSLSII
jgi:hypothetical protein